MRLADELADWLGRVEVVLAGGEDIQREAELALAAGEPMRARAAAHRLLARLPGSPLGLALLADACEAAHLDAELLLALEELAARLPTRAEVWLRLARARGAAGQDVGPALERALREAEPGSTTRREALLALAEESLRAHAAERALLWLDRLPRKGDARAALLRAEALLEQGSPAKALEALDGHEALPVDGRRALVEGRARAALGQEGAFALLLRAFVLDEPGAAECLAWALGHVPVPSALRERVAAVVGARAEGGSAQWRAAFARAEGRREDALAALREGVATGDADARGPLYEAALETRNVEALEEALRAGAPVGSEAADATEAAELARAARLLAPSSPAEGAGSGSALSEGGGPNGAVGDEALRAALDHLTRVRAPRLAPWADALRARAAALLLPPLPAFARWDVLLPRLDTHARALGALDVVGGLAELAASRKHLLRVAVVGEFNAGKSTFLNALIGEEVAPTSVLPMTATLHHLRYGPESFARLLLPPGHEPRERVVSTKRLREALAELGSTRAQRVELLLPLPALTRIEILDTPGFNAPDPEHAARARDAFAEADFALWLFDASQALKASERRILAEVQALGVPVQMLLNKGDRLTPDERAHVLKEVESALADAGLRSYRPPLALSARLALRGRLGDEQALAASGWGAVEALLQDEIVARADEIKERSLRRRLVSWVRYLADRAATRAGAEEAEAEELLRRASELRSAAARVHGDLEAVATALRSALEAPLQRWTAELLPLRRTAGGEPRTGRAHVTDPALERHAQARAVELLLPALEEAALRAAAVPLQDVAAFRSALRALLRYFALLIVGGATEGALGGRVLHDDVDGASTAATLALARSAAATLLDHLHGEVASRTSPSSESEGPRARELGALTLALA